MPLYWLAIVQALKIEHLDSKAHINLLEAVCPWGHLLLLLWFPLKEKKKWRIAVFPISQCGFMD